MNFLSKALKGIVSLSTNPNWVAIASYASSCGFIPSWGSIFKPKLIALSCKYDVKLFGSGKLSESKVNTVFNYWGFLGSLICQFYPNKRTLNGIWYFLNKLTKSLISSKEYAWFLFHQIPKAYLGNNGGLPVKWK